MRDVTLRPAVLNDAALLFRWRTDPEAMKQSGDTNPIHWLDHKRWVQSSLGDPTRTLLIGEVRNGALNFPVGSVRLDQEEDGQTVSIAVEPIMRKMGYGHGMLAQLVDQYGSQPLTANVRCDNTQSFMLFQKCGFKLVEANEDLGWCQLRRVP